MNRLILISTPKREAFNLLFLVIVGGDGEQTTIATLN